MKLFSHLQYPPVNLLLLLIVQTLHGHCLQINIPQAADACAGYPVTHYNLSLTRRSVLNQSELMLRLYTSNGASRIVMTLNSSDGICQNAHYHFQISAVNIIGSSTSSGMELCKH